ncbi:MAG TPA: hypothetical protein DCY93_01845 [Firmicutes bacterium]|nr:hypothetical protein [Bacillota bacterium]
MNGNIFEQEVTFNYSDFDVHDKILPSTLLRVCQDIASKHSETLNIGYLDLLAHGALWIISKISFNILGKIEYGKKYILRTWAHKRRLIYFPREYEMIDENGNKIMVGISLWHIFSKEERRIINPTFIDLSKLNDVSESFSNFAQTNIDFGKELETFVGEKRLTHEVTYSELDHNYHMNNTRYADLALNSLPDVMDERKTLCECKILFINECAIGDNIYTSYMKDNEYQVVRGYKDDGNVFVACFKYKEDNDER